MTQIQIAAIYDAEDEISYTACIQRNGNGWMGWIEEHPKVKCEGETKAALLETLETTLYETLEADWAAWDKQIAEDVKAGRLDWLIEKTREDFRAGRCMDLDEFLELAKQHSDAPFTDLTQSSTQTC